MLQSLYLAYMQNKTEFGCELKDVIATYKLLPAKASPHFSSPIQVV